MTAPEQGHEHERILVKHAVTGRMLVNSGTDDVTYTLEPSEEGGMILSIQGVSPWLAEEIRDVQRELNVFRFEEPPGEPPIKHWFYVGEHDVIYDETTSTLTIRAGAEIMYKPDEYWA
ncbi:hypothetical protein [Saccharibacillus kuerlensis]|uniref:Uncharacterized protein n=1 Tax=Saccharibacillus kuerlensis TaxID=459527 RepID=A0ABQ2KZY6_9BACL|nr:hypothetical protein [Saccharibacillus kuerlensis]GGN98278.1 hypothetical protein GCM10010969_17190 [Saccharibacillus kuerlensis]